MNANRITALVPVALAMALGLSSSVGLSGQDQAPATVVVDSTYDQDLASFQEALEAWETAFGSETDRRAKRTLEKSHPAIEFGSRMHGHALAGESRAAEWCLDRIRELGLKRNEREALRIELYDSLMGTGDSELGLRTIERMLKDAALLKEVEIGGLEDRVQRFVALEEDPGNQGRALFLLGQKKAQSRDATTMEDGLHLLESLIAPDPANAQVPDTESTRPTLNARDREQAESIIYEKRNLSIGCIAPDFTGSSVDGDPIALADTRGKVTVLSFFGFW